MNYYIHKVITFPYNENFVLLINLNFQFFGNPHILDVRTKNIKYMCDDTTMFNFFFKIKKSFNLYLEITLMTICSKKLCIEDLWIKWW